MHELQCWDLPKRCRCWQLHGLSRRHVFSRHWFDIDDCVHGVRPWCIRSSGVDELQCVPRRDFPLKQQRDKLHELRFRNVFCCGERYVVGHLHVVHRWDVVGHHGVQLVGELRELYRGLLLVDRRVHGLHELRHRHGPKLDRAIELRGMRRWNLLVNGGVGRLLVVYRRDLRRGGKLKLLHELLIGGLLCSGGRHNLHRMRLRLELGNRGNNLHCGLFELLHLHVGFLRRRLGRWSGVHRLVHVHTTWNYCCEGNNKHCGFGDSVLDSRVVQHARVWRGQSI